MALLRLAGITQYRHEKNLAQIVRRLAAVHSCARSVGFRSSLLQVNDSVVRIISVRKATRKELRFYEEGINLSRKSWTTSSDWRKRLDCLTRN